MAQYRLAYPTPMQERILRVIRQCIANRGEAPSVTEIGEAVGLRSRTSVHYHLVELETKGTSERAPPSDGCRLVLVAARRGSDALASIGWSPKVIHLGSSVILPSLSRVWVRQYTSHLSSTCRGTLPCG
jgi:repressor LexA